MTTTTTTTTIMISSQRILTGGHITRGEFLQKKSLHDTGQSGVMQSPAAVALMPLVICCCIYQSSDSQCFSMGRTTTKIARSLEGYGPTVNVIHGSLGPPKSDPQMASRSVQLFLHGSQTSDRHTDRQRYYDAA